MNTTLLLNEKTTYFFLLNKKRYGPYSLVMVLLLGLMLNPAFAEVTSIQTNADSFYKGDHIEFSGTVEKDSIGLVTIVIRDPNNEFVLLSQATINHDDTFKKKVIIENRFVEDGIYKSTGFILNMTKGMTAEFGVGLNEISTTKINKNPKVNFCTILILDTTPRNGLTDEYYTQSNQKFAI